MPELEPWTLRRFARRHPWWTCAAGLVVLSVALLIYAGARPSFDAYGWLVWGHQTLAGTLDTNAAPSWKPLPYVFTVPYALAGHYELWLWMLTCIVVSLGGALAAGRIAYRLSAVGLAAASSEPTLRRRRVAGALAAAVAVVSLLAIGVGPQSWWHYMLSAQSDTMIVALCLGAVDCHLFGRPRWAFALGALASLGRPEVWPFLAIYSVWAWRAIPSMRWLICSGFVAIVLLWFGIPALTSRTPFQAASNAFGSGRRLRSNQVAGTIRRFLDLEPAPIEVAALLSVCWALLRRDRTVLMLAAAALLWVVIEAAFSLHGWPGLGRYMFGAAGLLVVVAAVLVGRLIIDVPPLLSGHLRSPRLRVLTAGIGLALVAALIVSLIPTSISRARAAHHDLQIQRLRTREIDRLAAIVSNLGGATRLRTCGEPLTRLEYQTVLAWTLHVNVAAVGFRYRQAIRRGDPIVLFTPIPTGGWLVQALHQRAPACLRLPG
ncbi:MAG TPA: hypothetical protein VGI50_05300 [Solirubrobacteraceae bacterium]